MVESKVAEVLKDSKHVIDDAMEAVGQTKRIYGARLLVRGLLWMVIYAVARGLLETAIEPQSRASRSHFCPYRSLSGGCGPG